MEPWYNRNTALASPSVPFSRATNRWKMCVQVPANRPEAASTAIQGGADAVEFLFSDPSEASEENLGRLLNQIATGKVVVYFSGLVGDTAALAARLRKLASGKPLGGAILKETDNTAELPVSSGPEGFRTLAVDTTRFHNAGATITQELAFALSGASDLICRATEAGLTAADAAKAITIIFSAGTSHFPELAKLRAFRAMWAQMLTAYGLQATEHAEPELFVRASGRAASVLDPYTNILRLSTEALSSIVGGCDTLQLPAFDPAGSVPSDLAERITANIHHLLREESGLDRVVDPAAGSFYIDTLTASLCREAWKLFQELETAGGVGQAEQDGSVAAMISPAAAAGKKAINSRKRALIGMNRYAVAPAEEVVAAFRAAPDAFATAPAFEQLRLRALAHATQHGSAVKVAVWMHGDPAKCFRVAAFAEDFLRCGGFETATSLTLPLETKSCRTILADRPEIVALCWTGQDDMQSLPAILNTIHELHKQVVVIMAAKPPENAEELIRAGLDQFIHLGSDAYASLLSLQHKTGVL